MGVLRLTIQPSEGGTANSVSFDQTPVTLGRSSRCDIRLPYQIISSHHLTFTRENGGFQVVDVGSTNGTFLGDVKLTPNVPAEIKSGHALRIVDLKILVEIEEAETKSFLSEGFTLAESTTMLRKMMSESLMPKSLSDQEIAHFRVVRGSGAGTLIRLEDDLVEGWIGSAADSLVRVEAAGLAARIAAVKRSGDGYAIELAAGCDALIRVNDAWCKALQPLRHEDRLVIANTELVFCDPLEAHLAALDFPAGAPAVAEVSAGEPAVSDVSAGAFSAEAVEAAREEPVAENGESQEVVVADDLSAKPEEKKAAKGKTPNREPLGMLEMGLLAFSGVLMMAGILLFLYLFEFL